MHFQRLQILVLAAMAVLFSSGCGGSGSSSGTPTDPVSGSVKFKGAALAGATVTFIPAVPAVPPGSTDPKTSVRTAVAKTDASGEFKLTTVVQNDGAIPGDYTITVTKLEDRPATPPSTDIAAPPPKQTPIKSLIPEKYGKPGTSGLKATVKKGGPNRVELNLAE